MTRATAQALTKGKSTKTKGVVASQAKAILDRDNLVTQYLPYASSIANKVAQSLSNDADIEEIISNARLGLLEAAKRFDPKYNVDFKTFAYYRIRGAIYDGLRKTGWIPRSLYSKIKFEQAANEYLQTMSERQAGTRGEEDAGEIYDTVNSLASIYIISIDATEEPMEIEDKKANNIEEKAEFQKIKEYMRQAIEELPEKERKLIKMYYFQNKTLEEAGSKLGLSKSWTSRLHARALGLLFKKISLIQLKAQQANRLELHSAQA
jgi:RNA polymerase sigma factor for flagellar operon FliA